MCITYGYNIFEATYKAGCVCWVSSYIWKESNLNTNEITES